MSIDGNNQGRITFADRFSKIQGARPAIGLTGKVRDRIRDKGKTLNVLNRPRMARRGGYRQ
jgi:hypothetical protein